MSEIPRLSIAALFGATLALGGHTAYAQSKSTGKIVCWKDSAGKVIGCGDKVPPEYQDAATKELDKTGTTRGGRESAEEAAKRRTLEAEQAQRKAEEAKRLAEQKRQDSALINTYSNEKEIDQRRDRDLQVIELQIQQLRASQKNAVDRRNDLKNRIDAAAKSGKPAPDAMKEDLSRAGTEVEKLTQSITAKEKEMDDIRQRYADQKKRYIELKGGTASPPPAAAVPAPAKK